MSNYGYKPNNAAAFNQLIQQGLTVEEASAQSGVSVAASSYGYGTNSNAGAVIPGAGGTTDTSGLTTVLYPQSGTGQPAQQPAQTSTPLASSGFGYGTGINNPSVAPITDTTATTSPYAAFSQVQAVPRSLQTVDAGTVPTAIVDPQQALQQRLNLQPEDINTATSGLPVLNEAGQVVQGIRTNPETGETYYIDNTAADPTTTASPAAVEQSDAETARLARLDLAATPNESAAETNRLIEKNVQAVVGTQLAQRQAVLEAQRKMTNNGDWRVRLSLAANANYLYSAPNPGILAPLAKTGGVIFPYMPKIDTTYKADYDAYSLTHSNYRGYFYKSSYNDAVTLTGTFTAQDTTEANYLLAVIHFFRSVTKMFYGQDAQRGAPPPLVYLTGLGAYQFSAHPCVVTSFTYNLPNDVDYIRANSVNVNGTNLLTRRVRQDLPTDPISGAVKRLQNLFSSQGINKGAINDPVAPPTLGKNNPTYVPTKLDITLSLLPMQTRAQVSQVFSLKSFANGDLIKGGFW